MKKLITIVAIAMASVTAGAASFQWKTATGATMYGSDGTTAWSGTVSVYAYLASAEMITAQLVSQASTTNGKISSYVYFGDNYDAVEGTGYTNLSNMTFENNSVYNFYFVLEDTVNSKIFTSTTTSATASSANQAVGFSFNKTITSATQTASNWTSSAVPEPTSGLLLLLGMAGLALKRKRA